MPALACSAGLRLARSAGGVVAAPCCVPLRAAGKGAAVDPGGARQ